MVVPNTVDESVARSEIERANGRISRGIFIGRRRELAYLQAAVDDGIAGRGRIVLVAGEVGIGKTSLANQAAGSARARGVRTLWGRCHETGGAPPCWPWSQVLRDFRRGAGGSAVDLPGGGENAALTDLTSVGRLESDRELFAPFAELTAFLQSASRQQPLMILLDDVHWADDTSIRLLRFVAREIADSRVLLLGTYREAEIGDGHPLAGALVELRSEPLFEPYRLRGLAEEEVRALVAAIAECDVRAEFARALHRRTEGNPLFVLEILRHLAHEGYIYHDGARWQCQVSADELPIPDSVREVIDRRVGRLSVAARETLSAAALIGREFTRTALLESVELPVERVLQGLRESVRSRVLSEIPGAQRAYRFSHALLLESLAESSTGALPAARLAGARGAAVSPAGDDTSATLFRLEGDYWTIRHDGGVVRLRDCKGLHYVAELLRNPGQPLLAVELLIAAPGRGPESSNEGILSEDGAGVLADPRALRDYRQRLAELQEDIDEASAHNDLGRLAAARAEFERLASHVRATTGLGGRARRMPSVAERARQAVTKGIWNAVGRIGHAHPWLARHLTSSIKTGCVCIYRPDPDRCIAWQF